MIAPIIFIATAVQQLQEPCEGISQPLTWKTGLVSVRREALQSNQRLG